MQPATLPALVTEGSALLEICKERQLKLATAESCTGGLIVAILTEVSGSSAVVDRGFVTYSNEAKADMLGVPEKLIDEHGAVSEPVVRAMARGTIEHSLADIAVAVTGIAGPGGGSEEKPVGLVHIAAMRRGGESVYQLCEFGDIGREQVRFMTVREAFRLIASLA